MAPKNCSDFSRFFEQYNSIFFFQFTAITSTSISDDGPAHLIVTITRGKTGVDFTWHIYRQLQPNARLSMITFPKLDTPYCVCVCSAGLDKIHGVIQVARFKELRFPLYGSGGGG